MVKSAKSHLDEEEEADDYDSSSYRGEVVKADGKSNEQKASLHRSKHSETEQRRRSKINERFQMLRALIPQNDQKRDKASLLLEVIEYIQFLQEKLLMYEGSYQGWSQEPAKLIPWKNHHAAGEDVIDHSKVMRNGPAPESPAIIVNVQNPVDSNLGTAAMYKDLEHSPTTPAVPFNTQMQSNMFAAIGRNGTSTQCFQESVSDAENMAYQLQSQQWQHQLCARDSAAPNDLLNGEENLTSKSGSTSISNAHSKGILTTLTQALQSSGVDMSQTSISVQIDIGKRANIGSTALMHDHLNNQVMQQTGARSSLDDSDQARKRIRTENS